MAKCKNCGLLLDPGGKEEFACPRCEELFICEVKTTVTEIKPREKPRDIEIEKIRKKCKSRTILFSSLGCTIPVILSILLLFFYKYPLPELPSMAMFMMFIAGICGFFLPRRYYAGLLHKKGINLYKDGNYDRAIRYFDSSLKLRPLPYVLCDKGIALVKLERYEEATKTFHTALGSLNYLDDTFLEQHREINKCLNELKKLSK